MKKLLVLICFFVFAVTLIPLFVIHTKADEQKIKVLFTDTNETREVNLEEYLVGVVCAEMPASFETEALRAQAVAARTYCVKKRADNSPHEGGADVCSNPSHCKAYTSRENYTGGDENYEKIRAAVRDTAGEILVYDGEPILAAFHSSSGGRTEAAKEVWGGEYPYLVSVESAGEEADSGYRDKIEMPFTEFRDKLLLSNNAVVLNSPADISAPSFTAGGDVADIAIGGQSFSGGEIRLIFNLKSACFTINATNETVVIETIGYGHGVGMSQYGANAMAKEGKSKVDILTHYYSGCKIKKL
ncbi:MAG: stage II sporulation protein D [Clostridia bacterium]|nr:stage II sporulation protein D [Clostridia bacterium]